MEQGRIGGVEVIYHKAATDENIARLVEVNRVDSYHIEKTFVDGHYLCYSHIDEREGAIHTFFSFIHNSYDESIQVERNVDNVGNLLDFLKDHGVAKGATILDFGCGTCCALCRFRAEFDFVCYDFNENMVEHCRNHGFLAGTNLDGNIYFDAIISSYAMHFVDDYSILRDAIIRQDKNIPMAMNFHKSIGIDKFVSYFQKQKHFRVMERSLSSDNQCHGSYVIMEYK